MILFLNKANTYVQMGEDNVMITAGRIAISQPCHFGYAGNFEPTLGRHGHVGYILALSLSFRGDIDIGN